MNTYSSAFSSASSVTTKKRREKKEKSDNLLATNSSWKYFKFIIDLFVDWSPDQLLPWANSKSGSNIKSITYNLYINTNLYYKS